MPEISLPPESLKKLIGKLQSLKVPYKAPNGKVIYSDGLIPLVDEFSNGQASPVAESAETPPPLSSYSGNNPILLKLSQQKKLLVNAPRPQIGPSLMGLLKEIPESMQVRVIVPDMDESKRLKHALAEQGIRSFYAEHQNSDWRPDANIRIAARSRLNSTEFDLATADMVIFTDACMLIDNHSKGLISKSNYKHDLSELFDPTFPTRIPAGAHVLGYLSDRLPIQDRQRLWSKLSIDTIQLNSNGLITPTIHYRVVEFNHLNPPEFSSAKPSNFEVLKNAIWTNPDRNEFIARLAEDLAGECIGAHKSCCENASRAHENANFLSLLCTNTLQTNAVIESFDVKKIMECIVETSPLLRVKGVIAGYSPCINREIYIRCDAGIGMMADFKPSSPCLVIDIVDRGLPNMDKNAESRIRAYKQAGWIKEGNGIFLSRWNGV